MNSPQRSQPPSLCPLSSNRSSGGTSSPSGINSARLSMRSHRPSLRSGVERSVRSSFRSTVRPSLRIEPLASFHSSASFRHPSSFNNLPMTLTSFMDPVANCFEEPDVLSVREVQHSRSKMLVYQCHNQEKCMHASLGFCKNYFCAHLLLCHVTMPNYTVTSDPVEHRVVSTPSKRYEGRDDISITIPETEGQDSKRIVREVRRFGIRRCIGVYVDMPRVTDMS